MHIWFNKTFSSIYSVISLIKQADNLNELTISYSNPNPHAAAQHVADHFIVEPKDLGAEEYLEWCLQICVTNKVNLFWPGYQSILISKNLEKFVEIGVKVVNVAAPEVLELLNNKAKFCAQVKLTCAQPAEYKVFTNSLEFEAGFIEMKKKFSRLCVKPSVSIYGLGFSILDENRNAAQLLIAGEQYKIGFTDFKNGLQEMGECKPMLLMEYLEGQEYSVDCVGYQGKLIVAIQRKKSLSAGQGQTIESNHEVSRAVEELVKQFNLSGIFNIQFKETQSKPRLLEINARMSGGIAMACMAGPNLPYIAVKAYTNNLHDIHIPPIQYGKRVMEVSLPITTE